MLNVWSQKEDVHDQGYAGAVTQMMLDIKVLFISDMSVHQDNNGNQYSLKKEKRAYFQISEGRTRPRQSQDNIFKVAMPIDQLKL